MKIRLNNIGPFKKGELNLEDLTVIAGVNDTGKSFLNKVIYSFVKISNADEISLAIRPLKRLVSRLNRNFKVHSIENVIDSNFKFLNEIINSLSKILDETKRYSYDQLVIELKKINKKLDDVLKKEKNIKSQKKEYSHHYRDREIFYYIEYAIEISRTISSIVNTNLEFVDQGILNVNFDNESIKNKYFLEENSSISFKEKNTFFEIKLEEANLIKGGNEILIKEIIRDITYINNLSNLDNKNEDRFIYMPNHFSYSFSDFNYLIDARSKIRNSSDPLLSNKLISSNFSNLIKEMNKDFNVDSQMNYLKRTINKNGIEFKIANVSQGLVNLELFKLLILSGAFDENQIVIFDEPENYFHPKWQHWFVSIIFELIKETKCKIILSTHSPYIIESVDHYKKYNNNFSDLKVNFGFLTLKNNGNVLIENLKDSNKILELLVEPYNELDELKYKWTSVSNEFQY